MEREDAPRIIATLDKLTIPKIFRAVSQCPDSADFITRASMSHFVRHIRIVGSR
jgi:hypothetical protein